MRFLWLLLLFPFLSHSQDLINTEISTGANKKPVKETINLALTFLDKETKRPVPAEVKVEYQGEIIAAVQTDTAGFTRISLNKAYKYIIRIQAPSYIPQNFRFSFSEEEKLSGKDLSKTIFLQKVEAGKTITLDNILFGKSKYELLPESFEELDKVAELMKINPTMEIELAGHTDNIGDPQKNIELSENRVNSVKNYLVRKGIPANRIKSVGYGGSKPLYSNETEETRKLNRRVEMKVLKM
jgi:outer membrane protein OmpA-like peptidoglycan-associated protein